MRPTTMLRKICLWPVILLLSVALFVPSVFASDNVQRIEGANRYETAANIATTGWPNGSSWAIIAYGGNFPDALAATPLATKYDAPILLTESQSITPITKNTLTNLGVKNVLIVGGTGVITSNVENQLKAIGISTQRVAGDNRYETSLAIANQIDSSSSKIIVTTGDDFSSALSISSFAGNKNIPILLVNKNYITDNAKKYLSSNNIRQTYIVGNLNELSESVKELFPNVVRIQGANKYETNLAVHNSPEFNFDFTNVFLATGEAFADALAGSAYAAKTGSPVLLIGKSVDSRISDFFAQKDSAIQHLSILGGESAIPISSVNDYMDSSGNVTYSSSQIFNKVSPSVVYIETYDFNEKPLASGSGFSLDSTGKIATNFHVIEGANSAKVKTANGKLYNVEKILSYDKNQDLAILKIDGSGLTPVTLGDSDKAETGDKIYTIGNPLGMESTISDGLISTKSRVLDGLDLIQISAPISHGSSGGVLVNEQGETIGITSSGIDQGQNLNFAIPINVLKSMLSQDINKTLAEINPIPTPVPPVTPTYDVFFPELSTVPMPIGKSYNAHDYSSQRNTVFYYYDWYNVPVTFYEDYVSLLNNYGWTYDSQNKLNDSTEVYYSNGNSLIGIGIAPQYMVIYGYIH